MSDFGAGLAVGFDRGYQAAMDAVAQQRGKVGDDLPTVWYPEAQPSELDDLYSGRKPQT